MLHKPYCGNGKPFVYALFAPEDQASAKTVLSAMKERGFEIWPSARLEKWRMAKSALVLLFLSPAAVENEAINRAMQHAVQSDHPLLVVHLTPSALTPTQRLLLNSQQAILQYDCASDESFYEKLFGAQPMQNLSVTEAQKRAARITTASIIGGILLAVALAIYLALGSGATVPEDSLLAGLGYQGKMADITSIYLYGNQVEKTRSDFVIRGMEYDNSTKVIRDAVFFRGMQQSSSFGNISDVSEFSQLKNLRELSIAGNPVSDIHSLFSLKKLEFLDLSGDPVLSISGIESLSNLQTLCISGTQITDITPLNACKNLKQVYIDTKQNSVFSDEEKTMHFAFIVVGPVEEMDFLSLHIFGGMEDGGSSYNIFTQTRSKNVYYDYSFELWKNDKQIPITGSQQANLFGVDKNYMLILSLDQSQFGNYNPKAVYRIVVRYRDWSATYQLWHKFDPASQLAMNGNLIEKATRP